LAQKLGMDKAEIRAKNFIKKEQFPYRSAFGFDFDSVTGPNQFSVLPNCFGFRNHYGSLTLIP
jgi:CO/xanthine dehydrogenase Mo-binding subunit